MTDDANDRSREREQAAPDDESAPPIRCVDLTKRFGAHTVLDGINLTCHAG